MTAFSRSRLLLLGCSVIAPVLVAVACASEPADPAGDDDCGNTQTDVFNCGACGRACTLGQFCQAGQCACTLPYSACGPSCLNLQADPANCGSCGNACPASAAFCSNGVCNATCAQTQCGNLCTNTSSDILHCGACNAPCPIGASCVSGACACPAGTTLCSGACATTCGTGGSGGTPATGGTGGTPPTGGAGGAGATTTGGTAGSGTSGTGGMGPVTKLCATKVVPAAPTITDFESYDGTMPAYGTGSWIFTMGPTTAPAYAGLYALSENTVGETPPTSYMLTLAAGANASNWAARAANMTTTDWGGGIGFWMGCINASSFTGMSFFVRGNSPTGMATLSLAVEDGTPPTAADPAGGGTCEPAPADGCAGPSYTFPITVDWTQITVPWAMFTAGRGAGGVALTATGDEITGMSFGAGISYVPNPVDGGMPAYVPVAGMFEIAVDNLAFTQ